MTTTEVTRTTKRQALDDFERLLWQRFVIDLTLWREKGDLRDDAGRDACMESLKALAQFDRAGIDPVMPDAPVTITRVTRESSTRRG